MQIKAAGRCIVLLASIVFACPLWAARVTDFTNFSLRAPNGSVLLPGRLRLTTSSPSNRRPLVLFLHGGGEVGSDNTEQINENIDYLLATTKQRGAFLYAPQSDRGWSDSTVLAQTMTMIERAIATYNIDPRRIYVTGLSLGGGGVWNMITQYPDRFAAAVPICPVPPWPYFLDRLLGQPTWSFHAYDDPEVPVEWSREVFNDMSLAIGLPIPRWPRGKHTGFTVHRATLDLHYTEFPDGGHDIWNKVYQTKSMYDWMFAHVAIVPEPNALVLVGTAVGILGMRPSIVNTAIDEHTRECLSIDVARRLTSEDVLERLSDLFIRCGVPDYIRSDNGPEFTAHRVREWLEGVEVKT